LHLKQVDGEKLKEQAGAAVDSVGEAVSRTSRAVGGVVREHPIPSLLIGAGIAWAVYSSRQRSHQGWAGREDACDSADADREFGDEDDWNEQAEQHPEEGLTPQAIKEMAQPRPASKQPAQHCKCPTPG
jgi:hypothetical protein